MLAALVAQQRIAPARPVDIHLPVNIAARQWRLFRHEVANPSEQLPSY